jgi:hypothetical protein
MNEVITNLSSFVGEALARLIVAIIILLIGWVIAAIVQRVVQGILARFRLDQRVASATNAKEGSALPLERWLGLLVFWVIMLAFIVAALNVLNLTVITEPLNAMLNQFLLFLPKLFAAAILALVAYVIASIARKLVTAVTARTNVDARLQASAGTSVSISNPLGDAAFYLVWLFFLPAILGALGLESLLIPVQNMIDQILAYLPKVLAAGIVFLVGWFVARIVQRIVEGFLASAGVDRFAERVGISKYMGGLTVSHLLGLLVFIVILIPVITASLDALQLQSLTAPLTLMINQVLAAIPSFLAAAAILILTYVVARWFIGIAVEILTGVGFNNIPRVLGLGSTDSIGGRTLAQWAGDLALLVVMILAAVQAAQVVGWTAVTVAFGGFGVQIVQILFGVAIIAVGIYLANIAGRFVLGTDMPSKRLVSLVTRAAIVAFAGAMGLSAMGIANDIVVVAFGLTLGALAVAVALAFGLGGREAASKQLAEWSDTLNKAE